MHDVSLWSCFLWIVTGFMFGLGFHIAGWLVGKILK